MILLGCFFSLVWFVIRLSRLQACLDVWKLGSPSTALVPTMFIRAILGKLRFPVTTRAFMSIVYLVVLNRLRSCRRVFPACAALVLTWTILMFLGRSVRSLLLMCRAFMLQVFTQ